MSEELLKELSLLQDELMRLRPAVQLIDETSQNAKLIEKKIPKLTKKVNSIKDEALGIEQEIKNTLITFEELSSDPKKMLNKIEIRVDDVIDKFNKKSTTQQEKWGAKFQKELVRIDSEFKEVESSLRITNESYKQQVSGLLQEVEGKSTEIFEIYDVLDEMKTTQNEYTEFMTDAERILKEKLESVNAGVKDELNKHIDSTISSLKDESTKLYDTFSIQTSKALQDAQSKLELKEGGLVKLNSLYESKADTLISKIDSKSVEILKIYEELETIKDTNKKYTYLLERNEKKTQGTFEEMMTEFDAIKEAAKTSGLITQIDELAEKVAKFEENAHRHNFGGIPLR